MIDPGNIGRIRDTDRHCDAAEHLGLAYDVQPSDGRTNLLGDRIFQDITERKDAERGRDMLTARVALANETGSVGLWERALDTGATTWFAHMFQICGIDPSVVPSHDVWKQAIHEDDGERAVRAFNDALAGLKPFDTEFRVVWPTGEVRSIRAQAVIVRNAANEPVRAVGISWDNTDARGIVDQMHREQTRLTRRASRRRLVRRHPAARRRVLVSIDDVSGSGLQAAVVVGVARQIIRGISQLHADPMLILDAADRALCLEYPGVYVSAWVGLIDTVTKTVTYASAGHPPPLLVSKDGTVRELVDATTMLIGLRKGRRGQPKTVALQHGDALVLYTDGITEAGRDIIAGTKLLSAAAAKLPAVKTDRPADSIKRQVIPDECSDDVALLVVQIDCDEADRHVSRWRFDARDGNAAGVVRGEFVASLGRLGFDPDARANAELVFGELVGNVVRHMKHTGEVEVAVSQCGPGTVLHVLDRGGGFNHISRLPRDPYAEHRRGLFLIAALTEEFTASERPDGDSHARAVLLRSDA